MCSGIFVQTFNNMSVLIVLIITSLIVTLGFLIAFIWSVRSGQYEDDYTPSVRMLFDDKTTAQDNSENKNKP